MEVEINAAFRRYCAMRLLAVLLILWCAKAEAQGWSAYAGAGIGYDAFLRDKSVETAKNNWPFEPGVSVSGGIAYETATGFNAFLAATFGFDRIRQPVPEIRNAGIWMSQLHFKLMAGSGPVFHSGDKGNTITPYLQLGAGYYSDWDQTSTEKENNVLIQMDGITNDNWAILVGAGIEWRFASIVPSSINFQATYTPLDLFKDPVRYTAAANGKTYQLALQGKLLQLMLSYSVHWKFKRRGSGYND